MAGLAQQSIDQQSTAHADAPMDSPHGKLDSGFFQCFAPHQDMLIHAVDQRAIEIEQKCDVVRFTCTQRSLYSFDSTRTLARRNPRAISRSPALRRAAAKIVPIDRQ